MNPYYIRLAVVAGSGFILGGGIAFFIGLSVLQILVAGLVVAALTAVAMIFIPLLKK